MTRRINLTTALIVGLCCPTVEAGSLLFVSLLREKQIVTFQRDVESGKLMRGLSTYCPAEPACMSTSRDRKTLFVSFRSSGQLASYRLDPNGRRLKMLSVVTGGEDPAYLLPDRTGRFLLSAYYAANKVCVHEIAADGKLSKRPLQTVLTAEKAHGIALDSRNQFAFVPHTGANQIFQFRFDPASGRLSASDPPLVSTPPADHPRHICLHWSDRWAYVSNESGDSLGVYEVDRLRGRLRPLQTVSTLPAGYDGTRNATARCEITPNGRFVYVANRGHDSIACFAVNQQTGLVTSLGQVATEQTPRSFTITPDGRFLYAAGQGSGRLATFSIGATGNLQRVGTTESGPVSWWVLAVDVPAAR